MKNRNEMQAVSGVRYPVIPAGWPSRATRRAIRYGEFRLSSEWRQTLVQRPLLRAAMKSL